MTGMYRLGAGLAAAMVLSVATAAAGGAGIEDSSDGPDADATPIPPAAPLPQGAPVSPSNGTLYFSIDDDGTLYSLDVNTAEPTEIGPTGVDSETVGLTEGPNPARLIGSTWTDLTVINVDGSGFESENNNLMEAEGLAFDPATGTLYKSLNEDVFATASLTTGETIDELSVVGDGRGLDGLAWRATDGRVYGLGVDSDTLFAYTPATDTWAPVGATGISPSGGTGLAWDPIADILYAIVLQGNNNESGGGGGEAILYRIDPDTAESTLVGNTGLPAGGGLAFLTPTPPPPPPPTPGPIAVQPTFTG